MRDNDLDGETSNDLSRLALVHGDPQLQRSTASTAPTAEPDGAVAALVDCRGFILAGLDEGRSGA